MAPSTIARVLAELAGALVSPPRCAACDAPIGLRRAFCPPCARTVIEAPPVPAERAIAPFAYGGALARAIVRFKYEGAPHLARPLGGLLLRGARALGDFAPHLVAPVPLHATRLVARGYNQAALLAAPVARVLRASLAVRALVRTRDTPQQAALARAQRLDNVRGAFAVPAPAAVRGRRVLLVDDVCTTGATLDACAAALRAAGALEVRPLALAMSEDGRSGDGTTER
jgi:ComF family protein